MIGVITLFPEMFSPLEFGILGKAQARNLLKVMCVNPRDYTLDKHRTVDDRPYGGGPGMVMKASPLIDAIQATREKIAKKASVIYLSPQGTPLTQAKVQNLAEQPAFILIAGRYEGIDERVLNYVDEELSLGDYVLSGGELAAMVIIDAVMRLLPGALGDEDSASQDSFVQGLLDYPHYTRPERVLGAKVPEVLLQGDHKAITRWRRKQALGKTWLKRPELLEKLSLNEEDQSLLAEFIEDLNI